MDAARLAIGPVIERAQAVAARVSAELPSHEGLKRACAQLVEAARQAETVSASMKKPWSAHRLPPLFLATALLVVAGVLYWQFFSVSTLTLALPDRDAAQLRRDAITNPRVKVTIVEVPGSREGAQLLERGEVDLSYVQGGVPVSPDLARLELPGRELVLYFTRPRVTRPGDVHRVLTSVEGEGSHLVAQAFFGAWGVNVTYLHAWKQLTADAAFTVPDDVDAVFVVKDPGDELALKGAARLVEQGFALAAPSLGARATRFEWLSPTTVTVGWLSTQPPVPPQPIESYSVTTWLVARQGLTPRRLAEAAEVVDVRPRSLDAHHFTLDSDASELFQGVDAFLSILVNIGVAFLALLGLDVLAYRRQFHSLNSLVSLIAMLQSTKDIIGETGAVQREHALYLGLCSDMLSLISTVTGYYTQENSSLLFNNLSEVIHQRCDGLKLNIQLKLLHARGL